jgi:hypothetical protein
MLQTTRSRLFHTTKRFLNEEKKRKKPPMPLRESLEIDDNKLSNAILSSSIRFTLGVGYYLHINDYMHQREHGVFEATPEPLRFLVEFVQKNVPGAYSGDTDEKHH